MMGLPRGLFLWVPFGLLSPFVVFLAVSEDLPPTPHLFLSQDYCQTSGRKVKNLSPTPAPDVVRFPDVGCSALQMKGGMCSIRGEGPSPGRLFF
jgi:hypothetical protein